MSGNAFIECRPALGMFNNHTLYTLISIAVAITWNTSIFQYLSFMLLQLLLQILATHRHVDLTANVESQMGRLYVLVYLVIVAVHQPVDRNV